jgi:predicted peroxiredoxin
LAKLTFFFSGRNALWGRELFGLQLAKALTKHYAEVLIFLSNNMSPLGIKNIKTPEGVALGDAIKAGCKVQVWKEDLAFRGLKKEHMRDGVNVVDINGLMDAVLACDKIVAY